MQVADCAVHLGHGPGHLEARGQPDETGAATRRHGPVYSHGALLAFGHCAPISAEARVSLPYPAMYEGFFAFSVPSNSPLTGAPGQSVKRWPSPMPSANSHSALR